MPQWLPRCDTIQTPVDSWNADLRVPPPYTPRDVQRGELGVPVRDIQTSQELQMLSRSLSDCKSLTLNVMIQVLQFVSNSQLCH